MSARSLIQKIKQFVGLADGTGPESDGDQSRAAETDVTVEREPASSGGVDETAVESSGGVDETDTESRAPVEDDTEEERPEEGDTEEDRLEEEPDDATEERGESVEKIKGIGPTYRDRLEANGLGTVPELAESDPETVADVAQTSEGRAEEWIRRANNR